MSNTLQWNSGSEYKNWRINKTLLSCLKQPKCKAISAPSTEHWGSKRVYYTVVFRLPGPISWQWWQLELHVPCYSMCYQAKQVNCLLGTVLGSYYLPNHVWELREKPECKSDNAKNMPEFPPFQSPGDFSSPSSSSVSFHLVEERLMYESLFLWPINVCF